MKSQRNPHVNLTGQGYCGRLGIDDLLRSTSRSGPGGTASEKPPLIVGEMPANSGLLRIGYRSPGSVFVHFHGENAESLWAHAGIFPFSGDRDRRPVSIHTAWRTPQSDQVFQCMLFGKKRTR